MADVIVNRSTLNMTLAFSDGDDRAISVDNPDPTITAAQMGTLVDSIGAYVADNQILLGDKTQAACLGIKEAHIRTEKATYLDLT